MRINAAGWFVSAFVCLGLGAGVMKFVAATPVALAEEAKSEDQKIAQRPLTGDDVAMALGLKMWSFSYALPKANYSVKIWVEEWKKDGTAPAFSNELIDTGGVGFEKGDLVIALPNKDVPTWTVKASLVTNFPKLEHDYSCKGNSGTQVFRPADIKLGKEIVLVAMFEGESHGGADIESPGFEKKFDRLVLIKAKFTKDKD